MRMEYTMYCRTSKKLTNFKEMGEILDFDILSFRPVNEVQLFSALNALIRN